MSEINKMEQWGPIDAKILYMSFWFIPIARSGCTKWQATWPNIDGFFQNDRIIWVWDKNDMEARGTMAIENIILQDKKRENLWRLYQKTLNNANELNKKKLNISNVQLALYAKKIYQQLISSWDYGITPELANFAAPAYLRKYLVGKFTDNQIEEIMEVLLSSERLSFHQTSELEILKATQEKHFKEYANKWFWVENGYFESKILTAEYFKNKTKGLSTKEIEDKINQIERYPEKIKQRKREIIDKYKISSDIFNIADKLAFSIWWQDHRKGESLRLHSTIDVLSNAIAKKLKINFTDILYYTAEEWLRLFDDKPKLLLRDYLKERRKLSFFRISAAKERVDEFHGEKAKQRYNFWGLSGEAELTHTSDVKGIIVSRGKVRGRARVLLSHRLANKMKEGEILVAPMTSPDYIIAMRKASAVVTDVGGLMSHAAIVSRELGIPCIVGTKIATQIFKDGDLVEVDAERGIVKKI